MGIYHSALRKKRSYNTLDTTDDFIDIEDKYYVPKKLEDLDRMQNQHFIFHSLWKSNFCAPIDKILAQGARVLDVGCGPGTWILEMATEYQISSFVGLDIVAVYPSEIMPRNVKFVQADILKGNLPFHDAFDYVRLAALGDCLTEIQWSFVISEVLKILKPGGWIEIVENDRLPGEMGPVFENFMFIYHELLMVRGVNPRIVLKLESILAATNSLSNICLDMRRIKAGRQGGLQGEQMLENITTYCNVVIGSHMKERMNLTPEEYAEYWRGCVRELDRHAIHIDNYRFWGRKI